MYEGEWRRGKAYGKGKFSWPSGATYEGDFKSGRMEGLGTFIGSDGDTYRGSWSSNRSMEGLIVVAMLVVGTRTSRFSK